MIKSIALENWKTHQDTKISFDKGTNILVGKIGSGKSSIIDAICYSLYGTFPSLQSKKITLTEIIMFKPVKKKETKLKLEFEFDSKNYRVEREVFSEKVNTAKLFLDGKLLVGPKQTDVTEKVCQILGIDYDLFVKIVYSEQNEIDYFLKIAPGKRKEQFDNLFGINNLEKIKVNSRQVKNYLETELDITKKLTQQLQFQLENYNLEEINKNISKNQKIISELTKQTAELKTKEETLKIELDALTKQKQEQDSLNKEKNILDYRIKQLNLELINLEKQNNDFFLIPKEELLKKKTSLQTKFKENKDLEVKTKILKNEKSFFENQLSRFVKSIDSTIDLSKISTEMTEATKKLDVLLQEQSRLVSQKTENTKAIVELERGFSNCPVCDSQLSETQIKEKLKTKKEQQTKLLETLAFLEKTILEGKQLTLSLQAQEKKANEQQLLKEEKQKILSKIEKLEKEEKLFVKPCDTNAIETDLENIALAITYQDKQALQKEVLENQKQLLTNLSSLAYDENKYFSLLTDYKSKEEKVKSNNIQISLIQKIIDDLNKTISFHNQLSSQLQEKQSSITKLETKQKDMTFFTLALENSQEHLRKVLVGNINQTLEIIWPKIYPYGDYVSARLKAENDYVLEVETLQKEWIRVEGLLSGGERTCAALSIRVAIALSLTKKLGLLILDEPTHNLDTKTISMLSSILDKELPELVDQIFIITHDQKLLETANASKYLIERDKENDGVSFIKEE